MACSSAITLKGMEQTAVEKGINLIGTGDFTHPEWLKEIKANLEPAGDASLFKIKGSTSGVRFVLSSEASTIFEGKDKKIKKIHNCMLMPDLESVDALNSALGKYGKLSSDGRAQLSMSAASLVEEAFKASKNAFVFPAHAWTPYFGVFGALSGFDSMKDAYEDQEKHIYALETGLSSDPAMNWRISKLDKYAIISTSDMHSLPKIGREMTILDVANFSYSDVVGAIKNKDDKKLNSTLEFFPEEGKYHFDGHRQCGVSIDPDKDGNITRCPVCGGKIVLGVLHRINSLADRPADYIAKNRPPFVKAVPLREVVAYVTKKTFYSVPVVKLYEDMIKDLGTEYDILTAVSTKLIAEKFGDEIGTAIENMRDGKIRIKPGYAGVFGELDLLNRDSSKPETKEWKQHRL
ncbi:MAG: endonuclease Q family protein [Candidatus Marsarchaeota archaeon]|nr:endonuclease Q family protein [Candidatus Marsarchaeota archaeon]MCL5115206.1 endonuclease Q family protein [Candidatus Marsarchaeota archaeon]